MDYRLNARWVALIGGVVITTYLCWRIVQPFVNVILWALVLTMVFAPVHRRIRTRVASPGVSAGLSTLLVIVTILVPTTLITIAVINELRGIATGLSTHEGPWLTAGTPILGPLLPWIDKYFDIDQLQTPQFIQEHLQAWSAAVAASAIGLVGGVVATLVQTLLVVFTSFYLFRDG